MTTTKGVMIVTILPLLHLATTATRSMEAVTVMAGVATAPDHPLRVA